MSSCIGCKHADWRKTSNGRRHPSGEGKCLFQFPDTPLPLWAIGGWQSKNATTVREYITGSRYIWRDRDDRGCGVREEQA